MEYTASSGKNILQRNEVISLFLSHISPSSFFILSIYTFTIILKTVQEKVEHKSIKWNMRLLKTVLYISINGRPEKTILKRRIY